MNSSRALAQPAPKRRRRELGMRSTTGSARRYARALFASGSRNEGREVTEIRAELEGFARA